MPVQRGIDEDTVGDHDGVIDQHAQGQDEGAQGDLVQLDVRRQVASRMKVRQDGQQENDRR